MKYVSNPILTEKQRLAYMGIRLRNDVRVQAQMKAIAELEKILLQFCNK